MATLFDFAFLDNFSSIFVMLFIIVAFYAVMQSRKMFGTNPAIHFTLAFVVGVIFIFSKSAIEAVKFMIPWLMILLVSFVILLIVISVFIGADPISYLSQNMLLNTWYNFGFIIGIIIIAIGISKSVGQEAGPFLGADGNNSITNSVDIARGTGDVASSDFNQNLGATLFNPKVLSLILMFFILAMAAMYITRM